MRRISAWPLLAALIGLTGCGEILSSPLASPLEAQGIFASHVAAASIPHGISPVRGGNNVQLLVDGREAYPMIERLIDGARLRIDSEFFSFHNDESGRRIANKLIQAVQRGVQVNLILDNLGNRTNPLVKIMRDGGVRVALYTNGYRYPTLHPNSTVDHKKFILVDGVVGITGGMNIGLRYERFWHDLMVRFEGPVLKDYYASFLENWEISKGPNKLDALDFPQVDMTAKGSMTAQMAVTRPERQEIRKGWMAAIDAAKSHIFVQSPYFIHDELVDHLKKAAQRGVKVSAILPTVGDNRVVDYINRFTTNDLLKGGVKVYEYDTRNPDFPNHDHETDHFNHGKVITIDGQWTSIGTANADARSMAMSQEVNLNVDSPEFARVVEQRVFLHDITTKARPAQPTVFSNFTWPVRVTLEGIDFLL